METVAKYLKSHDFKLTNQRKKIIETIFSTHDHFTADDLHDLLRGRAENISKATIYRTLSLLCDSGLVVSLDFGRGQLYYEHVLGHKDHFHFICSDTGKVIEFRNAEIVETLQRVARARGFTIGSISLRVFGQGKACK
ncbi:MAG: Fur family transcriptional regulator [Planctomycetota bacterium]